MYLLVMVHPGRLSTIERKDLKRFRRFLDARGYRKLLANVYARPCSDGDDGGRAAVQEQVDAIALRQPRTGTTVECLAVTNRQFEDRVRLYGTEHSELAEGSIR